MTLEIFGLLMHFLWMCLVIFQICKLNKAVGELNPDPTYPKPPPPLSTD